MERECQWSIEWIYREISQRNVEWQNRRGNHKGKSDNCIEGRSRERELEKSRYEETIDVDSERQWVKEGVSEERVDEERLGMEWSIVMDEEEGWNRKYKESMDEREI